MYRESFVKPIGTGFSIFTPEVQKIEDIGLIRSKVSSQSTDWFRDNFPGIFSSGLLEGHVPVCEFITLRKAKPFAKHEVDGPQVPLYLELLGLRIDLDAWRYTEVPGLHFLYPEASPWVASPLLHVFCKRSRLPDHVNNSGGHEGQLARIYYLNSAMPNLLCMWAALTLLDVFTENLNKVRNSNEFRNRRKR